MKKKTTINVVFNYIWEENNDENKSETTIIKRILNEISNDSDDCIELIKNADNNKFIFKGGTDTNQISFEFENLPQLLTKFIKHYDGWKLVKWLNDFAKIESSSAGTIDLTDLPY